MAKQTFVEQRAQRVKQLQADWDSGCWLTGDEAGLAAGVAAQAVSQAASRPGNGFEAFELFDKRYYHIAVLSARWPDGPGTSAYRESPEAYERWVTANLIRLRK